MSVSIPQRFGRMSARARWSVAAFAVLIAGLLWSAIAPGLSRDGVPDVARWTEALGGLRAELRAGDTVWVQPPWRDDVVDAIEAAGLPPGVKVTTALALPHGRSPRRTLLLHDPSAPLPRVRRRQLADVEVRHAGGLEMAWLGEPAGEAAAVDYVARLSLAVVNVVKANGESVPCAWSSLKDQHVCDGLPGWMHVGPDTQTMGGRSEPCAWSHPITGGKVVIRWDGQDVPGVLHLSHGLGDQAASNPNGAPVTMTISADGKQIIKSVRTNARGMKNEEAKVPAGATSLKLEITTPNDGARHYCWRLTGDEK